MYFDVGNLLTSVTFFIINYFMLKRVDVFKE